MPLNLQKNLPAVELLKKEHIFVMDSLRASEQDIRPLRVVVLNLMPLKITTETDLVRLLSNTPLQVELDFMKIKGHTPKNTPIEHMKEFYKDFDEMQDDFYDGMIITGAPVEQMPFEEVNYWESPNMICQPRCSACSAIRCASPMCRSSEASTTSSMCRTAGIRRYAARM